MKLPSFKRLVKSDYPAEFKDLVERLSVSLNIGIESLYNLANNNISLRDNVLAVTRDITVSVISQGIPLSSTILALGNNVRQAYGLQVIYNQNLTNSSIYPTSGITLSWTQIESGVRIDHITGLPPGNTFLLRVVIFG